MAATKTKCMYGDAVGNTLQLLVHAIRQLISIGDAVGGTTVGKQKNGARTVLECAATNLCDAIKQTRAEVGRAADRQAIDDCLCGALA